MYVCQKLCCPSATVRLYSSAILKF